MKFFVLLITTMVSVAIANAQASFKIWPGKAPGSENWDWNEGTDTSEWHNDPLLFNVTEPALDFYPANAAIANGTLVIICPGGSFYYQHIQTEGSDVAKWLNKIGVSAFVLKYRVVHSKTMHPVKEKNEKMKDTANLKLFAALIPMAIADARQAIVYVRRHAAEFNIMPDKLGIMGFSAGGTLAVASAFDYLPENRPDFLVPVYPYVPPALPMIMMKDEPPVFIVAATDDELHLVPMSIGLYDKWLAAGISAELHIYSRGGHGFGMTKKDEPSDTWIERFGDWLKVQGLLNK